MRCGRLAVGALARDLAMESRRWSNGELESGGWCVLGWDVFVWKSMLEIRCLPRVPDAKRGLPDGMKADEY